MPASPARPADPQDRSFEVHREMREEGRAALGLPKDLNPVVEMVT